MTNLPNAQKKMTLSWLKGFFESDGCFTASFSGKYLKPVVKFSQKSNSNLLLWIETFLKEHTISSKIDEPKENTNRAPALRIQGSHNVIKFLKLITADGLPPFLGKTQRQLFVFQELLMNRELTIDEQKQLLEFNRSDAQNKTMIESDSDSIKKVKKQYKYHQEVLLYKIQNTSRTGTLLDNDFVAGLLDGDGSYGVSFLWKKTTSGNCRIEWSKVLTFVTDGGSDLTLLSFLCHIGSAVRVLPRPVQNAIEVRITKHESIAYLIELHKTSPLLGNYSSARFALLLKYEYLKSLDELKNKDQIIRFLTEYYNVCGKSKGPSFKYSLEECISIIESDQFLP